MSKTGSNSHTFDAYFKRALSPVIVLELIKDEPKYVYEISSEMKKRSNGRFTMTVLYPVLYRLEEQGYAEVVRTEIVNSRTRNYYAITPSGREYLLKIKKDFFEMAEIANLFLRREDEQDV